MADIFSKEKRSQVMTRVKAKNTKPEMTVRAMIHRAGYRFRLHKKDLPGTPDIVLARYKTVVFVHGCFWHQHSGCKKSALPTSNVDFWKKKLQRNYARDEACKAALQDQGWRVIVIWECTLNHSTLELIEDLNKQKITK